MSGYATPMEPEEIAASIEFTLYYMPVFFRRTINKISQHKVLAPNYCQAITDNGCRSVRKCGLPKRNLERFVNSKQKVVKLRQRYQDESFRVTRLKLDPPTGSVSFFYSSVNKYI